MVVHRDINNLPDFRNAVITTGTFDGIHKGHLKVIEQVKKEAAAIGGESVIVTFNPHPRLVLSKASEKDLKLITTYDEKLELLVDTGVDHVVVVHFTKEFSHIEPEMYISDFLVGKLKAKCIITGYDHHFGRDRRGDFHMLEAFSSKYQYQVKEIPEYVLSEIAISSTRIRKALTEGDMETANECLGYDFFLTGTVVHGDRIGRTLGFPTANIETGTESKLVPKHGIYIASVNQLDSADPIRIFPAVMSIGTRPTLNKVKEVLEAYLMDFEEDLYGHKLRVHLMKYIRPQIKFANLDELKAKIHGDEAIARTYWK